MRDVAIVPVKGLAEAKKRLSSHLSPDERRRLVLAMMQDVLHALHRSNVFTEVTVISPDETVRGEVQRSHVSFIHQAGSGLNSAVHQATKHVMRQGVSSLATVLADLPLVEPRDLEEIHGMGKGRDRVILSPSLKGGTNVMMRVPPDIVQNAYGRWSYAKHLRTAQKKGLTVYSVSNARLSFDVDTVEDLRTLRQLDPSGKTHAGRVARDIGHVPAVAKTV